MGKEIKRQIGELGADAAISEKGEALVVPSDEEETASVSGG